MYVELPGKYTTQGLTQTFSFYDAPQTFLKTMCGTPTYLAPEVILQGPNGPGYSFAVDAWSVGVIIYSCIANASPFQEDDQLPLAERIHTRKPDLQLLDDMGCSYESMDFVSRFMERNPAIRMTVCRLNLQIPCGSGHG